MRAMLAAVLATSLSMSGAFAADGALSPGKPAGTKQAQIESGGVLLVVGIVAVAAVIAVIASTTDNNNKAPVTPPATSTGTN